MGISSLPGIFTAGQAKKLVNGSPEQNLLAAILVRPAKSGEDAPKCPVNARKGRSVQSATRSSKRSTGANLTDFDGIPEQE